MEKTPAFTLALLGAGTGLSSTDEMQELLARLLLDHDCVSHI